MWLPRDLHGETTAARAFAPRPNNFGKECGTCRRCAGRLRETGLVVIACVPNWAHIPSPGVDPIRLSAPLRFQSGETSALNEDMTVVHTPVHEVGLSLQERHRGRGATGTARARRRYGLRGDLCEGGLAVGGRHKDAHGREKTSRLAVGGDRPFPTRSCAGGTGGGR